MALCQQGSFLFWAKGAARFWLQGSNQPGRRGHPRLGFPLHPIDYTEYGYPAYDYDWWDIDDYAAGIWNSGWYDGYWSYWTGQEGELEHLGYSGLGMSSVYLKDGDMHGWKYISFSEDDPDWLHPVYVGGTTSSACIPASDDDTAAEYYSPSGLRLAAPPATGLYLERRGGRTVKRIANTK